MRIDVTIPALSESVSEGTLLPWRRQVGELVRRDDTLVDLETDKVILEIPAPASGVLAEILFDEGTVVKPGDIVARLDTEEAVIAPAPAPKPATPPVPTPQAVTVATPEVAPAPIAPAFRQGRPERREPMSRLRRTVAERLLAAQRDTAMLTTFNEVNMQPVQDLRQRLKERFEREHGVRLGLMSFFVKAAVAALKQYPVVNAALDGNDIVWHDYHDIGVAVSSQRGLVVPVLRDADGLSFAAIEQAVVDFAKRAEALTLGLEDLTGGTFTITNGGVFGSMLSTPILNPPQSAILGMHRIQDRPVAENGQVVIRPMMYLALSYDHRLIDGRDAVLFLRAIKESLEDPARLMLSL